MFKLAKAAVLVGLLSTLTACTGHVQNTKNNCSYDYLLHPAISISKIIGGWGPAGQQEAVFRGKKNRGGPGFFLGS